jgi:hypothetical protein
LSRLLPKELQLQALGAVPSQTIAFNLSHGPLVIRFQRHSA